MHRFSYIPYFWAKHAYLGDFWEKNAYLLLRRMPNSAIILLTRSANKSHPTFMINTLNLNETAHKSIPASASFFVLDKNNQLCICFYLFRFFFSFFFFAFPCRPNLLCNLNKFCPKNFFKLVYMIVLAHHLQLARANKVACSHFMLFGRKYFQLNYIVKGCHKGTMHSSNLT